jgi:hypothetical protein
LETRNQKLSGRGGSGRGQGRKRDPLKDLRTGALTAQKALKDIDAENQIAELYPGLNPAQKIQLIFRLRDSAYGKPATSEEQQKPKSVTQINVNIRRVGA